MHVVSVLKNICVGGLIVWTCAGRCNICGKCEAERHTFEISTVAILTGKSDLFPLGKRSLWLPNAAQDLSGPKGPPKYLGGHRPLKAVFS